MTTPRMLLITDKRTGAQLLTPAPSIIRTGYYMWSLVRKINALMGTTHWTVALA